jgi:4-aminobutyrate aminotransferase-like enzyme/Ser/Thr protein kinase RdoA (MazF antagonist)
MVDIKYLPVHFSPGEAEELCLKNYDIKGTATPLPGELDHNFKIVTASNTEYILKINRPGTEVDYLDFQEKLLLHIQNKKPVIKFPRLIKILSGQYSFTVIDSDNQTRSVRLLEWIPGRLWSSVNPISDELLFSLGELCGEITNLLQDFNHPKATREFDWDIAQANWTDQYIDLFNSEEKECLSFFINQFKKIQPQYSLFRKSVIHNDANDNNIIASNHLINPVVETIIDYGDAAFSQTINDLAVAIAYAVMDFPDPLSAALPIVSGYHKKFPLKEEELDVLYVLVAMRLVLSVTKSAINKEKEPYNTYLQVSDKQAWALLNKWKNISPVLAHYSFRAACRLDPVPKENLFKDWATSQEISIKNLFPSINYTGVKKPDLSIGSLLLGNFSSFKNTVEFSYKIQQLQANNPDTLLAGGYLEARPVYSTDSFKMEGNNGHEYRTYHLGMDFWLEENTPVHAICDGEIISFADNAVDKDYGPTIIIKHSINNEFSFYTLYGHLSKESLVSLKKGMKIKKGDRIGFVGNKTENGNWPPHLHFQVILDLLDYETNFPGVCSPAQLAVWSSVCPDPGLLFNKKEVPSIEMVSDTDLINERKRHLGKSLSLSYSKPLKILRGEMQWLIDETGRRFLDTVNNVAHVGHEHPAVVRAGQQQMAVLNTNTRYLHENIIAFAKELCKTLPKELSVIHFVNSGSEANELAMRMATAFTNQKDIIALEVGYHGNTGRCIDISSYKFDGKGGKGKPEHTHIVPLPDSFRGKYRGAYAETGTQYASHIKDKIEEIKKAGRGLSAFIAESIVSCGGQIVLPDNYLKTAYAFIREAGGVCIADEVQVGFGRVGKKFWGFELQDVVPDIVTMGKPIGNGHPLAAVVCTPEIANAFANGMEYFNTFGGNPVSSAIGLEVLKIIKDEKLQENALLIGEYLKSGLRNLQKHFPIIGDVRGEGFFLGIEFVEAGKIPATDKTSYIANRMKTHGILMSVDGPQNNVLKIKPPMCFNKENANEVLYYLEKILKENFIAR